MVYRKVILSGLCPKAQRITTDLFNLFCYWAIGPNHKNVQSSWLLHLHIRTGVAIEQLVQLIEDWQISIWFYPLFLPSREKKNLSNFSNGVSSQESCLPFVLLYFLLPFRTLNFSFFTDVKNARTFFLWCCGKTWVLSQENFFFLTVLRMMFRRMPQEQLTPQW